MGYSDELWELYKLAGMQRPMNGVQMENMDSAYSSLRQVIGKLTELGVTSYLDLDKLTIKDNKEV